MALIFIGVGIILIVVVLYFWNSANTPESNQSLPEKPKPVWSKDALYAVSVTFYILSAVLLVSLVFDFSLLTRFIIFTFCIASFVCGRKFLGAARTTDERETGNLKNRAEAMAARNKHEREVIAIEAARKNEEARVEVQEGANRAQIAAYQTQENESFLRSSLVSPASREQISVDDWREVRVHEMKTAADLNAKLAEMQAQVRLALLAKQLSDVQKISIVQDNIDSVIKQIDQIESDVSISSKAKERMVADREEIIKTLQEDRRARQQGLLEAHNR